jgi:hypothetical protein
MHEADLKAVARLRLSHGGSRSPRQHRHERLFPLCTRIIIEISGLDVASFICNRGSAAIGERQADKGAARETRNRQS